MNVEEYYTKVTTIWQELIEFRPITECSCGGLKSIEEYLQSEYVMTFLMGLNDSYAALRAQILLISPLPSMNKVFSLVIQEEQQRSAGILPTSVESVTLAASSDNSKKATQVRNKKKEGQRPICSHCGVKGHVVDRCYKIHGYPPGYRRPQQSNSGGNESGNSKPQSAFFASLSTDQYSQLMGLLQSHLAQANTEGVKTTNAETTHVAGSCFSSLSSSTADVAYSWVIDSGASSHICFDKSVFINLRPAQHVSVVLPTQSRFMVEYVGDIKLTDDLILHNVLLVPQFSYNLLPVSALLKDERYDVLFSVNHCYIQDKLQLRKIGRVELK